MKIVIDNHHLDHSGGGEHVRMIISLLSNFSEIYVTKNPEFYKGNDFTTTPIVSEVKKYKYNFTPDLFIYIDYRGESNGFGKVNAQLCYYAIKKEVGNYDFALCINEFVARSVSTNWGISPIIIPPYFDSTQFKPRPKKKSLINIGNFFIESDGHSKNQHLLIEWFLDNRLADDGWTFDFFGFLNHDGYFSKLKKMASQTNAIRFHPNSDRTEMLEILGAAKFMVHAMGYGRSDPAQSEHFGLVAVQALLSGCRPVVHKSGGCPEIEGTIAYQHMSELKGIIESDQSTPADLRKKGEKFSHASSLQETKKFIELSEKLASERPSSIHLLRNRLMHALKR